MLSSHARSSKKPRERYIVRRQWRPADPPPTTDPWHLLLVRREYVATRAAMAPKRPSPGACEQHTPPQRSVRSRVTPTSHSQRETPNLRHIPPDSPEWTDPQTTCLSLGLEPSDAISRWRMRPAGLKCSRRSTRPVARRCSRWRTKPDGQRCLRWRRRHSRWTF